jgi:hypothetical protein
MAPSEDIRERVVAAIVVDGGRLVKQFKTTGDVSAKKPSAASLAFPKGNSCEGAATMRFRLSAVASFDFLIADLQRSPPGLLGDD